jgi:hypothetical protein
MGRCGWGRAAGIVVAIAWAALAGCGREAPGGAPTTSDGGAAAVAVVALAGRPATSQDADRVSVPPTTDNVDRSAENPLLFTDPTTLVALEGLGLSLGRQLGAPGETGDALVRSSRYASLVATIEADVRELSRREGIARRQFPTDRKKLNYAFNVDWLRDAFTHFELVGVSNRLDMMYFTPGDCGQLRLVYRLALQRPGRPVSRLPLFVSLIRRQPPRDEGDCSGPARAWAALDLRGPGRAQALVNFVAGQPGIDRLELNFQNLHGTGTLEVEEHAEYVLRSFDVFANRLAPRPLLNTPRLDLSIPERDELLKWVIDHFVEIDRGSAILPDRFSATRSVSVSPRGLARPGNRPFQALLGGAPTAGALAAMPYENASLARSPAGLLRRLDELTCPGCHQSRAIAGFHVLGEERADGRTFDALAVGALAPCLRRAPVAKAPGPRPRIRLDLRGAAAFRRARRWRWQHRDALRPR